MLDGINQLFERPVPNSILGWAALVLFLISIFIDISKIKLNPWKRILRGISSVFNAEVVNSQRETTKALKQLGNSFQLKHDEVVHRIDQMEQASLVWEKKVSRRHIIEFADECRRGVRHSQQAFLNVFDSISEYELLCRATNDPNHVVTESVRYIHEIYQTRLEHNDFV